MKRLALSFVLVGGILGTAGCGDDIASEMKSLADEVCACKDEACVEKANEKRRALRKKAKQKYAKKEDVPKDLLIEAEKQDKRFKECRRAIRDKSEKKAE